MRKIVVLASLMLFLGFGNPFFAQILQGEKAEEFIHGVEMVRFTHRSTLPNYIEWRKGAELPADQVDQLLRKVYQLGENGWLKESGRSNDKLGFSHYRYQQMLGQIPVEGGQLNLHLKGDHLAAVNGDVFALQQAFQNPTISEAQALQNALDKVNAAQYRWEDAAETRFLRAETENPMATWYPLGKLVMAPAGGEYASQNYRLAWKFDIYAIRPLYRAYVYVDAQTGEVILEQNRIHTADVLGSAVTAYSGTQAMTADQLSANSYRLRETGRGNGIQTFNMSTGTNYGNSTDFTDANNIWNNINAQQDEVATDAHWGAEKTYDFFWTAFGRNSIDGNGFQLKSYVHYDQSYNNAFWDGNRMTYGDGNGTLFTPLTAIDVTGHEISHGLTEFTANLVYSYESGALNESFSDIFGSAIEHYARPSQWSWKIGEDMTPSGNGIRNMQNPGLSGDPDTYLGNNWATGPGDNGGVHTNSGVQNKWYYILTIGENGTNDNGDSYSVTGLGWTKSSAIAFRNLTVYLGSSSDYADARFYAIRSAADLYGPCTAEVIATTNAWYAVGVGPVFSNTIQASFTATPTTQCSAPASVTFNNTSINGGTFFWDFGDGTTSTALSPQHTYANIGSYSVNLIAYGGPCGNDTLLRTSYVVIDTNLACNVTMSPTGSNSLQTACSGPLFDSGGPAADYGPNTNSIITIAPNGAASVTINFVSFSMELDYDYLYVYDGPSITSPLIGAFTGSTIPGNITSSGGSITLRQSTDPAVEDAGFEVHWSCVLPTAAPAINFTADNLNSCNGIVNFRDLTSGGPNAWTWTFGDGFSSNLQHPTHTYQANGVYTVSLTATNIIGTSTVTRTAYITVNKPAGPAANGVSRCGPGSVTLTASGPGTMSWFNTANGGVSLGTGSSYTTAPLTNSVVYYVQEETPSASQFMDPLNPAAVGGGGYHNNNSTQYLEFTVNSAMTLVSAYVDPGAAGNRTITLWDDNGTLIQDMTINIGSTPQRVTLNWSLNPGNYRIGGTNMDLYRNNSGPAYPYSIANMVSITGSSAGSDYYYYLYNWEVTGAPCASQRTAVPVTIDPAPTAAFSSAVNQLTVNFTDQSIGATAWAWDFGDGNTSSLQNPTHTYASNGSYQVSLAVPNVGGCIDTLIQTVDLTFVGIANGLSTFWEQVEVSPNPFSSQIRIEMQLPESGNLKVSLFDQLGKRLGTFYDAEAAAGAFTLRDATLVSQLASGTYLVQIEFAGERRCLRIVKQ